jgi:transposase
LEKIKEIDPEKIAYVDETGMDTYLCREYGWSERGKPLIGKVSGHKFKRTGVVAAQMRKSILAPLQYEGTMNSTFFEMWFEMHLLPTLPEGSVVVMDNASFHRKSKLFPLAEQAGIRIIFLPPYSPEYNPIENFWAWLKRYLRKTLPFFPSFDDALYSAFQVW